MTDPQDPFAAPSGEPQPPATPPAYGAPPPGYGAPPPAYGAPPPPMPAAASGELATWIYRVGGALIDGIIVGVAETIVGFASKPLGQLVGLAILLWFLYLTGTQGQSPGKKVVGIKLVKEADGQYLGFGMAVVRYIAHILDALSCLIGYLWPLWDAKRQTFADKIIGTVVVRT